jgi:hypothetical protein
MTVRTARALIVFGLALDAAATVMSIATGNVFTTVSGAVGAGSMAYGLFLTWRKVPVSRPELPPAP